VREQISTFGDRDCVASPHPRSTGSPHRESFQNQPICYGGDLMNSTPKATHSGNDDLKVRRESYN